jgi:hypothetical protein
MSAMRRMWIGLAVAGGVVFGCTSGGDDGSARATFRAQADAVFCTDLISARDTVISDVVDASAGVSPAGVATFAGSYEPILRDHIEALRALVPADRADEAAVAGITDAATAVADHLRTMADEPTTEPSTPDDLRRLATSPLLAERLRVAGLRSC